MSEVTKHMPAEMVLGKSFTVSGQAGPGATGPDLNNLIPGLMRGGLELTNANFIQDKGVNVGFETMLGMQPSIISTPKPGR